MQNPSIIQSCYLCEKDAELKYKDHEGYIEEQRYHIYHCDHCNTAFAYPLKINYQLYNHIYRQLENVPGYERYLRYSQQVLIEKDPLQFLANSEDMYWSISHYFQKYKKKNIKILEIGCGFGYLTYALSKAGFSVTGLDISQTAIEQATARYGSLFICDDVENFALTHKEEFDVVIFTEVIEHIENVKNFMQAAKNLLKPGGDLVLTTPNKGCYPKDILWETEPPPIHLWWFSEDSIRELALQFSLKPSFINFKKFYFSEFQKNGTYPKPDLHVRNFMPSRPPRLNKNGDPLEQKNSAQTISEEPIPVIVKRTLFKRILNILGLLKPLKSVKKQVERYNAQSKILFAKNYTLCAILKK